MRLLGKLTAIIICVTLCAPALSIMPLAAGMLQGRLGAPVILACSNNDGSKIASFCSSTLAAAPASEYYFIGAAAQGKSGTDFNRIVRALGLMG